LLPSEVRARHARSSFLKPSRTLGALAEWPASFSWVASGLASPAEESMVRRTIALASTYGAQTSW
jgi:hypothetical protein